jgi:hypothetical protein
MLETVTSAWRQTEKPLRIAKSQTTPSYAPFPSLLLIHSTRGQEVFTSLSILIDMRNYRARMTLL